MLSAHPASLGGSDCPRIQTPKREGNRPSRGPRPHPVRGDPGEEQASARFRAAAQPAAAPERDGEEAGRRRRFPRETLLGGAEPEEGYVPRARTRQPNRRRPLPERAISRPLLGPGQAASRRPSRVSTARPSPPHLHALGRPTHPPAKPRPPPASPSAAAEAAVGPIVVGIEVRHLPSPLLEEPAGQRGRTPQYNSSSPLPPRYRGCPPRCLIANRTHACARRRARPWADGARCWPRRALRPTWCGDQHPPPGAPRACSARRGPLCASLLGFTRGCLSLSLPRPALWSPPLWQCVHSVFSYLLIQSGF